MASLRRHEGYLLIDNRVSGGPMVERPVITCSHCHRQLMLNPLRTRERGYCPKCDHYVCDLCEAERVRTGICRPLNQQLDVLQNAAVIGKD